MKRGDLFHRAERRMGGRRCKEKRVDDKEMDGAPSARSVERKRGNASKEKRKSTRKRIFMYGTARFAERTVQTRAS